MKASVVIPALDEGSNIEATLLPLQPARQVGHEVVLVDGGSDDRTREIAAPLVDRLQDCPRGRALQMNAGAERAQGDLLVFLHADTVLTWESLRALLCRFPKSGRSWGRFDLRLSGKGAPYRLIERLIRVRSRLTGIATGDQTIFVRRQLFEKVGGYPAIPLMEDIALCKALRRRGAPLCLRETVLTSSRRWEEQGILRTTLLMWRLRIAFALGADPERLARGYGSRKKTRAP